ncbi:MAG: hypothetical protein LBD94_00130, partial [Rickettsiales bacterium]|nr:hypothetical protein [Rickettsiales bacterium]
MRKILAVWVILLAIVLSQATIAAQAASSVYSGKSAEYKNKIRGNFSKLEDNLFDFKSTVAPDTRRADFERDVDILITKCKNESLENGLSDKDANELCGDYKGVFDGLEKNKRDAIEKFDKQQNKAKSAVSSSSNKVINAMFDATNAVKTMNSEQLRSAISELKSAASNLKRTVGGKNNDTMFIELTQNNDLKDAVSGLLDALQNATSDNTGLQKSSAAISRALEKTSNSKDTAELGMALEETAQALTDAMSVLKEIPSDAIETE